MPSVWPRALLAAQFSAGHETWLRPNEVPLSAAPYPYDPVEALRGAFAHEGLMVSGSASLTFDVSLITPSSMFLAHVAQVLLVYRGEPVAFAEGSGFTSEAGLGVGVGTVFGLRWAYSASNVVQVVSDGGTLVCALAAVRVTG